MEQTSDERRQLSGRVAVCGKSFRLGKAHWSLKGLTYGPFGPDSQGRHLPAPAQWRRDLRQVAELGATAIRLYHAPPRQFLDDAAQSGLRVLIDLPWDKHRCFLEDWSSQKEAIAQAQRVATELGAHPAVLAISVANEIPKDIVRFHGARRIERFVGQLLDSVKQEAPDCLTTYTNYPSTEFLTPGPLDFVTFNVYLEDPDALAGYLDRLHHVAGPLPLVLGECGLDSYRHGEAGQADGLRKTLEAVYRRGLAGAFVFSFTDDWFTGGNAVENWAFGITDRNRREKPAARAVQQVWDRVPNVCRNPLPKVSVVVCSYNGAATLEECLRSLTLLNYPDYEVILVDDGSTDGTPQIADQFPQFRTIRQANLGLSAARNTGARAASGQIVAYTDSDCVADPNWLLYLVTAVQDQRVDAIGGPNLPPPEDNWVAKCVAASPGGPSHVMLDDRLAEHVPGCNMAFNLKKLLALGGFDPQFRVAGDDVDICWRFMDAGLTIGYAPAALVWHHRRATVRAYLKQQQGYGRSEAMLQFKHPQRFNRAGAARWNGIIYGEGAVGLPLRHTPTYYGKFGTGLFQIIYRHNKYSPWAYFTLLEWHLLAALLLVASLAWRPLAAVAAVMWLVAFATAARSAWRVPLPAGTPARSRLLVFGLHLLQPIARAARRYTYRLTRKKLAIPGLGGAAPRECVKRISPTTRDLYWESHGEGNGREELLESLTQAARRLHWPGIFGEEWSEWDATLFGGRWHGVLVRTATEELGRRRFTRVRCKAKLTQFAYAVGAALLVWTAAAVVGGRHWAMFVTAALWVALGLAVLLSARRSLRRATDLVWHAGNAAQLNPIEMSQSVRAAGNEKAPPIEEPTAAGLLAG